MDLMNWVNICFAGYLATSIFRYIVPDSIPQSILMTSFGLILYLNLVEKVNKSDLYVAAFVCALIFSFSLSSIIAGRANRVLHVIVFIITNISVAMTLLRGGVKGKTVGYVFYGLASYFLVKMLMGVSGRDVLDATSHNGISMLMLTACITFYVACEVEGKDIDLRPAVITFLISIWGIGRSGIISSGLLCFGLLAVKYNIKLKIIFIACALLVPLVYFHDDLNPILESVENITYLSESIEHFKSRAEDQKSPRVEIWGNYFKNMDIERFLFGVNVFDDEWAEKELYAYNYHNSWITLHSQTGVMGVAILFFLMYSLIMFLRDSRVFFVLASVCIIRWSTDNGLFFESWDFLVYAFIIYSFDKYFLKLFFSKSESRGG